MLVLAACSSAPAPGTSSSAGSSSAGSPAVGSPSTAASALVSSRLVVPAGLDAEPFDIPRTVRAPQGWQVALWARVPGARLAAWTPDGALLVSRPGAGDVVELRPSGTGAPEQRTIVDGLEQPHGLAFDGTTLYIAESDRIDAYATAPGSSPDGEWSSTASPTPRARNWAAATRTPSRAWPSDGDGWLYFSIGSTGNVSAEDRDADPQRATIERVRSSGGTPEVYARGVRNGTGLAVDPTGAVWTAVNNRDNIAYPYRKDYDGDGSADRDEVLQAYVNDHPLELLAKLTPGRDLGWPYCDPDPDVDPGSPTTPLTYANRPYVRDVQTNADGSKLDCAALPPVEQGLGAHSAPLGLAFVDEPTWPAAYRQGALVGVHGSWNRQPPRAPEVSFFPRRGATLGTQQTLLTGFQAADGDRWGRPVMAVAGPDGAVYVTDDAAGAVYRMTPPPR